MVFYDTLESPLGQILLAATERGLSAVAFTDEAPAATAASTLSYIVPSDAVNAS